MTILRTIKNIGAANAILGVYFLCTIILSGLILVRLFFTVNTILKDFNILMYGSFLYLPLLAVIWLFKETERRKSWTKSLIPFLLIPHAFLSVINLQIISIEPTFPEYFVLWFPVPLMAWFYVKWKSADRGLFKRRTALFLVTCLVIVSLLPNITAYVFVDRFMQQVNSMNSEWDKASLISQRVNDMTDFGRPLRANEDYWKFLLTGAGLCKEMSMAGVNLMTAAGLESRRVVFPGEDHALIEVKISGNWLVADPGFFGGELKSRTERAEQRIGRVGSLSYVAAYTENGFIELTQQYVSTDTIAIRITRNGDPVADAQVILKHTFRGFLMQLPCNDRAFHTDVNGTVTLHMGKLHYINEFKGSEEYYWIYVNGKETGYNVTSTGTGQIRLVEIDLSH